MNSVNISIEASVFQAKISPEEGKIVGYAALIKYLKLEMPNPYQFSLIARKNKRYSTSEWQIFTPVYQPEENVYKHLQFAIKYEGINLLFFKKLFQTIDAQEVVNWLNNKPSSEYTRKIWFLYEFLMNSVLHVNDADVKIKYTSIINERQQFAISNGSKSSRHRLINNLPGTIDFCPLIYRTPKLEEYIKANLANQQKIVLTGIRKDILQRASAFLLLRDSKASFIIEGESPKSKRAARWGQAIGQAGMRDLSKEELLRLQQLVIENPRFLEMGYRKKGGFVGEHDRTTGEPIPDHISAKWQDLETLMEGFLETDALLLKSDMDAVISAAAIAFGFVFIHPLEDGNGRLHRYLMHHVLSKKKFSQQSIIFPVSAAILDKIDDYRKVLETYSLPLLDFIHWKETKDHNIEVLNYTIDFYRYFDATKQAEFLYDCVHETIQHIIPKEVEYLTQYDAFKKTLENEYEMPDKLIAILVRFLEQDNGSLSKRAREKEFEGLTDKEVLFIEKTYGEIFRNG